MVNRLPQRLRLPLLASSFPLDCQLPGHGCMGPLATSSAYEPHKLDHKRLPNSTRERPVPASLPVFASCCVLTAHLPAEDHKHRLPEIDSHLLNQICTLSISIWCAINRIEIECPPSWCGLGSETVAFGRLPRSICARFAPAETN